MDVDSGSDTRPTLRDLMASVGYLLLFWGHLERRLAGKTVPDELQFVRQIRNDLCHGMRSALADPMEGDEPHVVCESAQRAAITYTWTDLQTATRMLEAFNARAL